MKNFWKNKKLVIHGEESYSGRLTLFIDQVSRGTDSYKVELVNSICEDLDLQPCMPSVYYMIAIVMFQSGFEQVLN